MDHKITVLTAVSMIVDKMTDDEIMAINNAVTFGFDPSDCLGYDKARGLFEPGTIKMHAETKEAFDKLVSDRLFN